MSFLRNLLADMRTRGMLLPAILLALFACAVPFLLGDEADPVLPSKATGSDGQVAETLPAVFANPREGVRDFQKRLQQFQATNPFKQRFPVVPPVVEEVPDTPAVDGTPDTGPEPPGTAEPPPEIPVVPVEPDVQPPQLTISAVDVLVGNIEGTMKTVEKVPSFAILPSEKRPVFAFFGVTEDGTRAAFSVSNEARVVKGAKFCAPSRENCLYLNLEKGQAAQVTYPVPDPADPQAEPGPTYRLKLTRIRSIPVSAGSGK